MKVLIATSEAIPYAKTGGLADVAGSLVHALRGISVDARLIMPMYKGIKQKFNPEYTGIDITVKLGRVSIVSKLYTIDNIIYFIRCDEFFNRKDIYGTAAGDFDDNSFRFIYFARAIMEACRALEFMPEVIHCNDWQTSLVPILMKQKEFSDFKGVKSLLTIHNLGYQGIFPETAMALTCVDDCHYHPENLEYFGQINLLKSGIVSADMISTVSETYSKEILHHEVGFGLDGVLRNRVKHIIGIVNGIDYDDWNPADDAFIKHNFCADEPEGKEKCKNHLLKLSGLKGRNKPLIGHIGRLSDQKGIDILIKAAADIFSYGANIVILGKGDDTLQRGLRSLKKKYPDSMALTIGFDEELARHIYAGSDMLLIPSLYEPCGLTQMIAMRYATVPVVRATGGLEDTVIDYNAMTGKGTGFKFGDFSPNALLDCIKRACSVYVNEKAWEALKLQCMTENYSWRASAKKYKALYKEMSGK